MRLRLGIGIVALALLIGAGLYLVLADQPFGFDLSQEGVATWVKSLGAAGGLGIAGLMIIHSFLPFPAELVVLVAGLVYGTVWGTIYSWIGAMIGAVLCFMLARWLGHDFVEKAMTPAQRARLAGLTEAHSAEALLAARLIPVISFNLVNYGAGLTMVSWGTFLWTTAIGILPMTIVTAFCGERMTGGTWADWLLIGTSGLGLWCLVYLARRRLRVRPQKL